MTELNLLFFVANSSTNELFFPIRHLNPSILFVLKSALFCNNSVILQVVTMKGRIIVREVFFVNKSKK